MSDEVKKTEGQKPKESFVSSIKRQALTLILLTVISALMGFFGARLANSMDTVDNVVTEMAVTKTEITTIQSDIETLFAKDGAVDVSLTRLDRIVTRLEVIVEGLPK